MQRRERAMCVLVAALTGGVLALVGAPGMPATPLEAPTILEVTPIEPPTRTKVVVDGDPLVAIAGETAARARAPQSRSDVPSEVRLCWSPTARRLLGSRARLDLEQLGARVRVFTESDRGALGRLIRGDDDLALIAGSLTDEERAHGIQSRVLGYHVLVALVHEKNTLHGLPGHLLRSALIGEARDWQHIGGAKSAPIAIAAVAEDPFTDQATSLVLLGDRLARGTQHLKTDDDVCAFVAAHEDALGLCSLAAAGRAPRGVRVLLVDTVAPSAAAFAAGLYPYASPIRLLAKHSRLCEWLDEGIGSDLLSPVP